MDEAPRQRARLRARGMAADRPGEQAQGKGQGEGGGPGGTVRHPESSGHPAGPGVPKAEASGIKSTASQQAWPGLGWEGEEGRCGLAGIRSWRPDPGPHGSE